MSVVYVDTSAAMKSLFSERESVALSDYLATAEGIDLVSACLLHTELYCAAARRRGVTSAEIADVLQTIELIDVTRGDFIAAGTHGGLRAADALHLTVALRLAADEIVTYDRELAAAAAHAGVMVRSPGA